MIEKFKLYLEDEKPVPSRLVRYYVAWVVRFFQFLGKSPGEATMSNELESFLSHLSMDQEEWQVKQAKDAVQLYLYFYLQT